MATVTLHTSATDVGLLEPKRIMLSGKITGVPEGSRPRLVLRSESVDYVQPFPNVDGRSDAAGRFRFAARPEINTTYRVATADGEQTAGQSPPVEVRVYPAISIGFDSRTPRSFRALLTVTGPQILPFEHGSGGLRPGSARYGYFYLVPRRSKFAYRLGRGRLRDDGCSVYCSRGTWKRVRLTRRVRRARGILGCIRGTGFVGMGLPTPACGRRVVRVR
jgi:hypothetical protein